MRGFASHRGLSATARRSGVSSVVSWQQTRICRLVGGCSTSAAPTAAAEPPAAAAAAGPSAAAAPVAADPTAPAAAGAGAPAAPLVEQLDIRVGRIVKCERHPDADSLYVEEVDCGDPEGPRTIVSGLVQFVPLDAMQGRGVVVLANLKPRNMRGVKSNGMLLCASNAAHDAVEPLTPPPGAAPGERVWFGDAGRCQAAPAEPNRVQKKKIWEAAQPDLTTRSDRVAAYKGEPMLTSAGPVTAATLAGASIS